MAITVNKNKGSVGLPADQGMTGFEHVRLTLDGSATSATVTLSTTSPIKTITGCCGGTSNDIPAAGVAATTGFTVKFAAGTNAEFLDLLVFGKYQ